LLQVLDGHAFNVAAVDLARPHSWLWFNSPDSPELARDFGGSSEGTGEECDGSFSSRGPSEKGFKVRTAGGREREIKRPAEARSRLDGGMANQNEPCAHTPFSPLSAGASEHRGRECR
jgi:hypothetical protein